MAITDWPADERPRERLLAHGPGALSDAELLAIFLRTGVTGMSAVDLARHLLQRFGHLFLQSVLVHWESPRCKRAAIIRALGPPIQDSAMDAPAPRPVN